MKKTLPENPTRVITWSIIGFVSDGYPMEAEDGDDVCKALTATFEGIEREEGVEGLLKEMDVIESFIAELRFQIE